MKNILFFMAMLISGSTFATKIVETPLNELVKKSDYVLVGTVKDIKLFNKNGKEKKWFGLSTGPGIDNTLYYYIELDKDHALKGSGASLPDIYKAEIWKMFHKNLKDERELYLGRQVVLFLKGNNLEPVSLQEYIHVIFNPEMLTEIEELIKIQNN